MKSLHSEKLPLLFLLRMVPMLLVMGTIFFVSHQSGEMVSFYLPAFFGVDKLCHLAIYALLAMTVLWCFGAEGEDALVEVALKTVIFCLVYGVSDEFHQSFIPQRSVSAFDLVADMSGVMLVSVIWLTNRKFRTSLELWQATLAKMLEGDYTEIKYRNESS